MRTIKLEFPYIAAITDDGRLAISERRTLDLPPKNLVTLSPRSVLELIDFIEGVEEKKKDCTCGADKPF